jgi:RimJ/RimL family protein N-acetyltransferase
MTSDVALRDVAEDDLAIFFEQQLDPAASRMAAFTRLDPANWDAFIAHWTKICNDAGITIRTVLHEGRVAGHVASFERLGEREVTYWIGKEYWGQGIATKALSQFLGHFKMRPLYARAAKDNLASLRVLEKCGFTICGQEKGYSNARREEVEEYILKLGANETESWS